MTLNENALKVVIVVMLSIILFVLLTHASEKKGCSVVEETYTESVRGCDRIPNCGCLHNSFFGMGACDSCMCIRYSKRC